MTEQLALLILVLGLLACSCERDREIPTSGWFVAITFGENGVMRRLDTSPVYVFDAFGPSYVVDSCGKSPLRTFGGKSTGAVRCKWLTGEFWRIWDLDVVSQFGTLVVARAGEPSSFSQVNLVEISPPEPDELGGCMRGPIE